MKNATRIDAERYKTLLKEKLLELMPLPGARAAPFSGASLYRRHSVTPHQPMVYKPVVVLIAQGRKSVRMGRDEYIYGDNSYFIAGVDMPASCALLDVTPARPFLCLSLELDRSLVAHLSAEAPPLSGGAARPLRGAMVADLEPDLLDAFLRLLELIERPEQAGLMAPLVIKEIHYRLLAGPFGSRLRTISTFGTPCNQIARAIAWLRHNFMKPLQVSALARQVNMATSTFHKHFKEVTELSPLQYQKRLRLEEAQRLMLAHGHDASQACAAVGYESLTQFTREYKRLFGDPPRRNIVRMRAAVGRFEDMAAI